jgi:hypothetical protein
VLFVLCDLVLLLELDVRFLMDLDEWIVGKLIRSRSREIVIDKHIISKETGVAELLFVPLARGIFHFKGILHLSYSMMHPLIGRSAP